MRYWTQCLRRVNSFHSGNLFAHELASIIFGISETVEPKSDCTDCHTPEESANYAGNEPRPCRRGGTSGFIGKKSFIGGNQIPFSDVKE